MIAIELIKNVRYFIYKLFLLLIMAEYILNKAEFLNQVLHYPDMLQEEAARDLSREYLMKLIGGILIFRFLLIKL